jgi:hypothetical protein
MTKITLINFIGLSVLCALLNGCEKKISRINQGNIGLIEVEVLSHGDGSEFFLNGKFDVIRVDELENKFRSIVVMRRIGSPGTILLSICTPYRMKQDGQYALIGWVHRAKECPGFELLDAIEKPGAILNGVNNCTTLPNRDSVFLVQHPDTFLDKCEKFSLELEPRQLQGSCDIASKKFAFDTFGLLKCGKALAP